MGESTEATPGAVRRPGQTGLEAPVAHGDLPAIAVPGGCRMLAKWVIEPRL